MREHRGPLADVRIEYGFLSQKDLGAACNTDPNLIGRVERSGRVGPMLAKRIIGTLNAHRPEGLPPLGVADIEWILTTQGRKKQEVPLYVFRQVLECVYDDQCYPRAVALGTYAAQVLFSKDAQRQQELSETLHHLVKSAQGGSLSLTHDTLKLLQRSHLHEWFDEQEMSPNLPQGVSQDAWKHVLESGKTCLEVFLGVIDWNRATVSALCELYGVEDLSRHEAIAKVYADFLKSVLIEYEYRQHLNLREDKT